MHYYILSSIQLIQQIAPIGNWKRIIVIITMNLRRLGDLLVHQLKTSAELLNQLIRNVQIRMQG